MNTTHYSKLDETEEFKDKFKGIVIANGIEETVSHIIINDADLHEERIASITKLVTVLFEDPDVKPINLFVKVHTQCASRVEMLNEMKAFEKEATFLTSYVKAASRMCKKKGRDGLIDFYPKCYYGNNNMIVLENLVLDKGFKTVSMKLRQNLEEAKIAIKTIAKHHAVSNVMIQECGGASKFFEMFRNLDYEGYDKPSFAAMMKPALDSSINFCINILKKSGIQGSEAVAEKLKKFLGKGWSIVLDALKTQDHDSLMCLGHGDYWNNNMMFLRDKETNKIIQHVAIDFQITRYNSAVLDLGYYLFTSVQPKVRQTHLHELLEIYKDTYNSVCDDLGFPENLTFEKVFLEYRKKLGFGFWMGFTMAVGPVMEISKETDINSDDPNAWSKIFSDKMNIWIENNPDKSCEVAEEVMRLMEEYDGLLMC